MTLKIIREQYDEIIINNKGSGWRRDEYRSTQDEVWKMENKIAEILDQLSAI